MPRHNEVRQLLWVVLHLKKTEPSESAMEHPCVDAGVCSIAMQVGPAHGSAIREGADGGWGGSVATRVEFWAIL